jgi:rRNA small subunit pseudouridine methyltransferase Nep1
MDKVTFIFLETSLELVPNSIRDHPAVLRDARRRGRTPSEILLDDSKHHSAIKLLEKKEKRGRPDIIHLCLLSVFDSPLNPNVYVHTVDGKIIKFSDVRLPRNYNRFVGLMEKLLKEGKIRANGKTLIEIENLDLQTLLKRVNPKLTILMTEGGSLKWPTPKDKTAILIGAFPHGDFDGEVIKILEEFNAIPVSLGKRSFTSLYVTNRVICLLENSSLNEGV